MTNNKRKAASLNIMVTGGSGFLGSHIADALTDAGHKVTIYDIEPSKHIKKGQKMVVGDVLDQDNLVRNMEGIDMVFHMAAISDIDIAHNQPQDTMKINVLGTNNVLEAARENDVKRVVFASTIYVYSKTGSFYRVSKHACELLLEAYNERYGIASTILRFGTLYGTRANESNSVFRYLKEAFVSGQIQFKGTGDEVREYIHVQDAAKICTEILKDDFAGKTLILTGHHRMKLSELLDMINEILGNKIKINYEPKNSESHYVQTPYSYIPNIGKKIVMNTYCDLGQSLVEILNEIDSRRTEEIRVM